MECTLATLIACFSWSGLYVDTAISAQDAGIAFDVYDGRQWSFRDTSQNPYGVFAIGYSISFKSIDLALEASHRSSFALEDDKGVNAVTLRMRWHPFRANR